MLIHSEKLNPCKCGSKKVPILDSDDFVPCWDVSCQDCGQRQWRDDWSMVGAVRVWNEVNKIDEEC